MFKLATIDYNVDYFPVEASLHTDVANSKHKIMAIFLKKDVIPFSLDAYQLFDMEEIEDAFDCEFLTIPDEINSPQSFRKWIMEMKFK
ncbi:TPA: hypothetical protein ACTW95_000493 [Klebsiella quasipneumoniae subsp. similipneumoniae]